jgi:RNA polymerase sigma-70 factor, ECF subfamily
MIGKFLKKPNDRKQFESEVLPHLDALYGLAMKLARDPATAEDLVQDSLVKAFRFWHRFEKGSNIKAWLFKILTNTFYNSRRKDKNIRKLEVEAELHGHSDRFLSEASQGGRKAEDILLGRIASEEIRAAVDTLPDDYRLAVLLCDLYDFSYREISEIVDCPIGTVMSRLYRGRRMLQGKLQAYAVEQGYLSPPEALPEGADAKEGTGPNKTIDGTTDLGAYRRQRKGSA